LLKLWAIGRNADFYWINLASLPKEKCIWPQQNYGDLINLIKRLKKADEHFEFWKES
jgi:hypothetical protein